MKSIRKRILIRVLGLLVIGTLIMGWASHHDSTHEVEELFDAQLGQSARVLIGLLGASQGQMSTEQLAQALLETTGEHPKLGHRYESKLAFQVRNASGTVIARSFNVPQLTDADWQPGFADLQQDNRQWRGYVLDSDESEGMPALIRSVRTIASISEVTSTAEAMIRTTSTYQKAVE